MNNNNATLSEPVNKIESQLNNIIFHSLAGPKTTELISLLKEKSQKVYVSDASLAADLAVVNDIAAEEQDTLIIAFPDNKPEELNGAEIESIVSKVLSSSFTLVQKFVQTRMKKRFGQIICLLNAAANGLAYTDEISAHFASAQGGLVGLMKTTSKEYSKRGIITNVLYIDWQTVSLEEVANRTCSLLKGNTSLRGQVFALDGGKWL